MKKTLMTARRLTSTLTVFTFGLLSQKVDAAISVTWNTGDVTLNSNYQTYTRDGTGGFISDVQGGALTLTGLTDTTPPDELTINAPLNFDLNRYIEISVIPSSGFSFSPTLFSAAITVSGPASDISSTIAIRSSLDGFSSIVGTATYNPTTVRNGGFRGDLEADISSIGAITSAMQFRLYPTATDGSLRIHGSNTTLPEGIRIIGPDPTLVPEPSSTILIGFGCLGLVIRRSRK